MRVTTTTVLEGADAMRWFAKQATLYCVDQEQAEQLIEKSTRPYRKYLVEELDKFGYTVSEEKLKELEERDAKNEAEAKAKAIADQKAYYITLQKSDKRTTSKCALCKKTIGRTLHYDGGRGKKAHVRCVES